MAVILRLPEITVLSRPERQWRAAFVLGWPLALGAAPFLLSLGDLPLCAFRALSGFPCPLCGGIHACVGLLHGDLAAAWQANPGILFLLAVAALHAAWLAREALAGRSFGGQRFWSSAWASGGAVLLAAWMLRLLGAI
jgi:hypothetical protein